MIRCALLLIAIFQVLITGAQQKNFEGSITFNISVRSKVDGLSEKMIKKSLLLDDSLTIVVKEENFKRLTNMITEYHIGLDERGYIKFRPVDTLYLREYASDTTSVLELAHLDEKKTIQGFECRAIRIKASRWIRTFFYAPALYRDPELDKKYKLGRHDAFSAEAKSLWLEMIEEVKVNCTYCGE